jgi:hypothetical protein
MIKKVWGYKASGEACLFEVEDGLHLPAGWSEDYHVITDPKKQTAEAITEAAGPSAAHPVRVHAEGMTSVEHPAEPFPMDFRRETTPRQEATKPEMAEPVARPPGRMPVNKDKI